MVNTIANNLDNLEVGNIIIVRDEIDFFNLIQLKIIQLQSYENLFLSYVNKTCDEINNFDKENYFIKYTNLRLELENIKSIMLQNALGDKYDYVINNFIYRCNYDFNINAIIITLKKRRGDK